ncbi:MAG TPA: phosphotransferase [Acidimicrobiales bacterium]|nr:phosphotransferase [Acidimicrobiales bacterium]
MAELIIGATAEELLTPAWLSDALGLPISGVELTAVGTGQIGDCQRLTLTYSQPCEGPASLVAKVPSQEPTSRNAGVALGTYRKEANFYMQLRDKLSVRAPFCRYVDFDDATCEFVLLLEDLAPAVQGNQITGCTPDEAALAVAELPNLHAPMWGDPKLGAMAWLLGGYGENPDMTATMVGTMLYPGFKSRYEGRIDEDILALAERMFTRMGEMYDLGDRPRTLQHSDYRLDNMLFGTPEGGPPVAIVDWQTLAHGYGIADLSYFIGAGLPLEDRRTHEKDLVKLYHEGMTAQGVDLTWDELWWQYRRHTTSGLVMAIGASQLVGQTDRGDDMFVAMAQGAGRHALDLDFEGTLS